MNRRDRLRLWLAERLILRVADRAMSEQTDDNLRYALAAIDRARP